MNEPSERRGSALGALAIVLRLGLTSFGGPIAHLGYFRAESDVIDPAYWHPPPAMRPELPGWALLRCMDSAARAESPQPEA